MMGGDAANNTDLVKIAGKDAAKGYFFISPPSAHDFDTPEAKDFFSRYKAQYNSLPSSVWSVLAGDAFKVIVAALQAGTDANPEAVAKYLKKDLKEYPGLTGKLGFNEKGDRIGDLYQGLRSGRQRRVRASEVRFSAPGRMPSGSLRRFGFFSWVR